MDYIPNKGLEYYVCIFKNNFEPFFRAQLNVTPTYCFYGKPRSTTEPSEPEGGKD
mgnify:CR=1 FL=1